MLMYGRKQQHYKVINLQLEVNEFKKMFKWGKNKKFPHKLFIAKVVDQFLSPLSYSTQST